MRRGWCALPERSDRDLVAAIRAELAAIEPTRATDRAAERAGLGAAASGRARSPVIARLAVRLAEAGTGSATFDWGTAPGHCRVAYLRGVFLARGSLSVGTGRAHLEFVTAPEEAPVLAAYLAAFGLPAASRMRRGSGVLTWKSTETILAFLRNVGASVGVLELESLLVKRALAGHLNRVLNAEGANLSRSVLAAARQLAAIDRLDAEGRLPRLAPDVRMVAGARREAPEQTLTEIAQRLGLSRARVQRAFERIEAEALRPA